MSFASVCVLSYERPHLLRACLESLRDAGEPFELIVHDDGSKDTELLRYLRTLQEKGLISTLILNRPGHNEGVGEAVRRMFAIAQGDILVKVDQDLVWTPGWLKGTREILTDLDVGAVGSFQYLHEPCVFQNTIIDEKDTHYYVTDFVGSSFAIPRLVYEHAGGIETHADSFAEDVGLKKRIKESGHQLALPIENLAVNVGFGYGPSTVCEHPPDGRGAGVARIHHEPHLFSGEWGAKEIQE